MNENKNPEKSSDEILDLISKYSDATKNIQDSKPSRPGYSRETSAPSAPVNAATAGAASVASEQRANAADRVQVQRKGYATPQSVAEQRQKAAQSATAPASKGGAAQSRESTAEVTAVSAPAHYTDHDSTADGTVRMVPDGGHFTDDGGNSVQPIDEAVFADVHFSGNASPEKRAKARTKARAAYKRAKRRNRQKRPHGSITIPLIKAVLYSVVVVLVSFYAVFGFFDIWPGIIPMANDVFSFVNPDTQISVTLTEGMNTNQVAELLEASGVIDEAKVFKFYIKYKFDNSNENTGEEDDILGSVLHLMGDFSKTMFFGEEVSEENDVTYLAGDYVLSANMNYDQIISTLTTRAYVREEVTVTIPEGYGVEQIIDLLVASGIGQRDGYIYAINEYPYKHEFVKMLEEQGYSNDRIYRLEGYLYPDTYIFYKDAEETEVINKMLNTFSVRVWSEYYSTYKPACEAMGFTFDEMVTFASIVQAEGANFSDFENISQVFHNRFDSPDFTKMESCATVQYVLEIERLRLMREEGIYEDRHDVITDEDIEIESAYNTYKYEGLPAGAVCNPGLDAFEAALYPDMPKEVKDEFDLTTAYYFNSDLAGNIYYAQTPYQHSLNVQKAEKVNQQIANGTYVGAD